MYFPDFSFFEVALTSARGGDCKNKGREGWSFVRPLRSFDVKQRHKEQEQRGGGGDQECLIGVQINLQGVGLNAIGTR